MSTEQPSPARLALRLLLSAVLLVAVGGLAFSLTFWAVAGGGQTLDPGAPGDQWIFLGGVAGFVIGPAAGFLAAMMPWMGALVPRS